MNGKDNIINKILADADAKCQQILQTATEQAQQISRDCQQSIEESKQAQQVRIQALSAERMRNRLSTAQLDGKKYLLQQKQQLIAQCYQQARQQIASFDSKQKANFVGKLLQKYAEQGETVICCTADKDVVTQKFLDGFKLGLKLDSKTLDADGGIILQGNGYQKDLTLARIVGYLRDQTEAKVANALFGE